MPKPKLPAIPEIKGAFEYIPSGKYQLIMLPVLFILDMLIGILISWLAPTIFILAGLFLPSFEGASGGSIFNILMGILFGLAFLGALGYGIGWPMWQAGKFANCRNPKITGIIGGIASIASVVVYIFTLRSYDLKSHYQVSDVGALALELAPFLILITGIASPIIMVKTTPFCEKCGRWFGDWRKTYIPIESSNKFVETLFNNTADEIKTQPIVDSGDYIEIRMRDCDNCDGGNFQIQTVVHWDQLMENKNKVHNKENWFTVMVHPEMVKKLEATIKNLPNTRV